MLTKDLLSFHVRSGLVRPDFVEVEDAELQRLAGDLLSFYHEGQGGRRGELEETIETFLRGCPALRFARGLNKLLLDRCEFAHAAEMDYPARRAVVLTRAAELLAENSCDTPERFRQMVTGQKEAAPLYADLPANERLTKFKEMFPKELLQRYNVALVQGLLFSAGSLTVRTGERKAANLRRMFKFLKFFRLLARIFREEDGSLRLEVDGPLSILDSARKYGLQLASFFPAVCHLADWQLEAKVTAKGRDCQLKLDQSSGLVSHYRHISAYVPDEVMMFARHFKEKVKTWQMKPDTPFISIGGGEVIFPDFTFENKAGDRIYLELFHRWHRANLLPRLRFCIARGDRPLILGIDRSLYQGELKDLLATGALPQHRYFIFNDYPTVRKVQACLDGFTAPPDLFQS